MATDPIEDTYEPKYINLDDVPISGPDEYSQSEKRLAIYNAESSLELDTNSGNRVEDDDIVEAHRAAVMNLATHVLTHAAEEPSDVTLGDMQSGGGTITEYSSRYLDEYNRLVEKLNDVTTGSGDPYGNFSMAVNSGLDDS